MKHITGSLIGFVTLLAMAAPAGAQQSLTVYCAAPAEWCEQMVGEYRRKTGINVLMTRRSAGETYAQVRAEAARPRGDVWWGGTGDNHLQAAAEGLTVEYESPAMRDLYPWAVDQWQRSNKRTVGVYTSVLGLTYNTQILAKKGLPEPRCWKDLLNPKFRDEIQMADPNSSGTAYTMLATIDQLFGHGPGFDYLKALHSNIASYTKSGGAPARNTALGEVGVGGTFGQDAVKEAIAGAPVKLVMPCEGTGYEVGSMSIIRGAGNMEAARAWYDWALTPEAQALGFKAQIYQVMSNRNTEVPAQAPKASEIKLIDYDFAKYGSSEVRKNLLDRWTREVQARAR